MADFGSRVLGSEQLERLSKGIDRTFGIVTGGVVTVNAGLVLNVSAVAANDYVIAGAVQANAYAGGTVTLDAADATNPRLDIVYIDTSGAVGKVTGTPAATPAPPEIGDTRLALAEVIVVANDTVIASGDIVAKAQKLVITPMICDPHAVSGTATLASSANTPYGGALLGSAAADGIGYFRGRMPVNFQGLRKAVIVGLPNGTGNLRHSSVTNWAAHGEAMGTHTDSIAAATVAVTDNQMTEIDVSAGFTSIAALDNFGFAWTRLGTDALDTITDFEAHYLYLELY